MVQWEKIQSNEILVNCPFCRHQTVPPEYPLCEHMLFVYIDPTADDGGFDYVRPDFARSYLQKLNHTEKLGDERVEFSPLQEEQFLSGNLPPFPNQVIQLHEELLQEMLDEQVMPPETTIFDTEESEAYYPCRVVAAFGPRSLSGC